MSVPEAPRWYLTPKPLTFLKQGGVTLQDLETVHPVLVVKLIPQFVPGMQGPQADGKGTLALGHALQKNDVKYLRNFFHLTHQQPVQIDFRLSPMHSISVLHH